MKPHGFRDCLEWVDITIHKIGNEDRPLDYLTNSMHGMTRFRHRKRVEGLFSLVMGYGTITPMAQMVRCTKILGVVVQSWGSTTRVGLATLGLRTNAMASKKAILDG